MHLILRFLHTPSTVLIICGDFSINCLDDNHKTLQLDNILLTYNLTSIVSVPTRVQKNSKSAIDNFSIDLTRIGKFTINPLYNGWSDHDAQILFLNEFHLQTLNNNIIMIRNINKYSLHVSIMMLNYENWDEVFSNNNVDNICNSFLNTYLQIFIHVQISCTRKRELYLVCSNNDKPHLRH